MRPAEPTLGSNVAITIGLAAAAVALRPQLSAVAPLLPAISRDLGLVHWQGGLLTTLPVFCTGAIAPVTVLAERRWGSRAALGAMLWVIAAAGLARAFAAPAWLAIALTLPYGLAVGVAGALLPVIVRQRLAARRGLATGVYSIGINLGATLSAAFAVNLAGLFGGWRGALAALATIGFLLAIVWRLTSRNMQDTGARPAPTPGMFASVARSRTVWLLAGVFGFQAAVYYGLAAWIATYYIELHWSATSAGSLTALLILASLPGTLLVTFAGDRIPSRRAPLAGCSLLLLGAVGGFVLLPSSAIVWAVLAGFSLGCLFPLALVLVVDASPTAEMSAAVSGIVLGFGYVLAATTPFLLGILRDWTGSFRPAMASLAIAAGGVLLLSYWVSDARAAARAK